MKNMIESKCLIILILILILKSENAFLMNDSNKNIISQMLIKDNCSEGYQYIELKHNDSTCVACPGEKEKCSDCCYPPEVLVCNNGQCRKKEDENLNELQIAAQIGLTLVLLIGILVLLMIIRRACNSVNSDSRRRNLRRWPWRRRSNSTTRNNNDEGDSEFPWPWRRHSNESRISERTLPPSYEDTRFIHLEKPPTYEEALQLALTSSLEQTSTTQEVSSNQNRDNPAPPRRSRQTRDVATISMNIRTPRIGPPMGDGRGLRSDLEITSNQDDQAENNPDSWLDILRIPPTQIHKITSDSYQINNYDNDIVCESTEMTDIPLSNDDNEDHSQREDRSERNLRRSRTGTMSETNISESSSPSNDQNNPMTNLYSRNNNQQDHNSSTMRVTETSLGIDNEAFDYDV